MRFKTTLLLLIFTVIYALPTRGFSQIIHTQTFTDLLNSYQLAFTNAKDHYYHICLPEPSSNIDFDLFLCSDEVDIEFRYSIVGKDEVIMQNPQVFFITWLADAASNEDEKWMNTRVLDEKTARREYGADWAAEASFRPKEGFSTYTTGILRAFMKEELGLAIVVVLFDDENEIPAFPANMLQFN